MEHALPLLVSRSLGVGGLLLRALRTAGLAKASLLSLSLPLFLFSCSTHKYVASTHPNGKPEVVIYMKGKGDDAVKVMEKVYYPNGQMEYVGHFANGVENGEWMYYYENGTKKFLEHWANGLEEGVQYDYSPDGQIYREMWYEKGKLVKTVDRTKQ
jgi:antitoxin component YwqK of YwqJK toxin-antitoxin module